MPKENNTHTKNGRNYGKTASTSRGERPYGRPAPEGRGERKFERSDRAPRGERPYGRPAPESRGERKFERNDQAPQGERIYGRPAPSMRNAVDLQARRMALDVLIDVHERGAFASLALGPRLKLAKDMKPEDRRLVTNLVYGTIENEIRLDYVLDQFMAHPTTDIYQRDILRMGAYQVLFLDRVPDHAAIDESVKMIKALGQENVSGLINGVLRNLSRKKEELVWPKREDDFIQYLHIMSSTPVWLVEKLINDYSEDMAEKILMNRSTEHPQTVRPNMLRLTDEQFEKLLDEKSIQYKKGKVPHSYKIYDVQELPVDVDYLKGNIVIQGQSSMLAAEAVQAKPGMKILDACAAPGGKSAYMCETMQLTGRVFAWELHEKRGVLLENTKRRLGLENLRITVRNATTPKADMENTLDAILIDAPCSGTGVLAEKPDIKQRLKPEDIDEIVKTQAQLLETLCGYVKVGGLLVYSTCAILPEENEKQIANFLQNHPEFSVEAMPTSVPEELRSKEGPLGLQLFAHCDEMEGFYIVRLRRKK